jgi:hypothetical protein
MQSYIQEKSLAFSTYQINYFVIISGFGWKHIPIYNSGYFILIQVILYTYQIYQKVWTIHGRTKLLNMYAQKDVIFPLYHPYAYQMVQPIRPNLRTLMARLAVPSYIFSLHQSVTKNQTQNTN